jgi:hypothetical protein
MNEEQKRWLWAKLYKTGILDLLTWNKQQFQWNKFSVMIFKADNVELYEAVRSELFPTELPKHELRSYILSLDSVNILTCSHSDMIKEIVGNVDSFINYSPARIVSQLIPPHVVKTASDLEKLLNAGYDQIPKFCLLLENNTPTQCATTMLFACVLSMQSLDIAKWLLSTQGLQYALTD